MRHYIYKVLNGLNGKVYIGKTNDLDRRKVEHFSEATRDRRNSHLYNAIRKYGEEHFTFHVVAEFQHEERAYEAERFLIAFFDSTNRRVGYNNTLGGDGVRPTSKERERRSQHGKTRTGPRNPFYGRVHTPETKAKIAKSRRKYVGPKHPLWGQRHSDETRQRISEAKRGWRMGDAQRQQVSQRHRGERSSTAKVTNAQAKEIRQKRESGVLVLALQAEYGLSRSSVYKILAGTTFKEQHP